MLRQLLKFWFYYIILWLVFFIFNKLIFLVYEFQFTKSLTFLEILKALFIGLRMDMSMTGYILAIVGIISILLFWNTRLLSKVLYIFSSILFFIFSFLLVSNLELYRNWGFHLDHTPLQYLNTPKEMLASTSFWLALLLISYVTVQFLGFRYLYNKKIKPISDNFQNIDWKLIPLIILFTASTFLPIRGGVNIAPLNTGMMFFSEKQIANHLAINPIWNFVYNLNKLDALTQSTQVMDSNKAQKFLNEMMSTNDNTKSLLNTKTPNILLIILESFSAQGMKEFYGNNAMPWMSKIAKDGILFTNVTASNTRTDKGLVSILSGYPAQPINSIMKFSNKTERLPYISKTLKENGYNLQFYYGGDINFTNINSYIRNGGFQNIISDKDFPKHLITTKWGVHDHHLFDTLRVEIPKLSEPFFATTLTLSSHEPFDVPHSSNYSSSKLTDRYFNSIHYTDSCLGNFIEKSKKEKWWNNTLVILIADHSTIFPHYFENNAPLRYHIPMIWTGGALKNTDTLITKKMSQNDLAKTLLSQLDMPSDDFIFSKNILADDVNEFGFYTYKYGFGYLKDSLSIIYNQSNNEFSYTGNISSKDSLYAFALWQSLNDDFVKR